MLCKYKHRKDILSVFYPEGKDWLVEHTFKHVINNYAQEGWGIVLNLDDVDLSKVLPETEDYKKISNSYLEAVKRILQDDNVNPRNVSYSFRKGGKNHHFVVIDENGFSVVIKKMGKAYMLVTGYGFNDMETRYLGDGFFQFKKLFNDSAYRLNGAIAEWNGKFEDKNTKYKNVFKELSENWELRL